MIEKYEIFLRGIEGALEKEIPIIMFRDTPFLQSISKAIEEALGLNNVVIIPWKDEDLPEDFFKKIAGIIKKRKDILMSRKLLFIDWTTTFKLNPCDKGGKQIYKWMTEKIYEHIIYIIFEKTGLKDTLSGFCKFVGDILISNLKTMSIKKLIILLYKIADHVIPYGEGESDYFWTTFKDSPNKYDKEVMEIFEEILGDKIDFEFIKNETELPKEPNKYSALLFDRHTYYHDGILSKLPPNYLGKFGALIVKHDYHFMGILPLEKIGSDNPDDSWFEIEDPNSAIFESGIEERVAEKFVEMFPPNK